MGAPFARFKTPGYFFFKPEIVIVVVFVFVVVFFSSQKVLKVSLESCHRCQPFAGAGRRRETKRVAAEKADGASGRAAAA